MTHDLAKKMSVARRSQAAGVDSVDNAIVSKPEISLGATPSFNRDRHVAPPAQQKAISRHDLKKLKKLEDMRTAYRVIREQTQKVPSQRQVADRSGYDRGFVGKHWELIEASGE